MMGAGRIVLALTLWLAAAGASFAEYPERPIRLLLPFPPGGAVDIVARAMTAKMSDDLGKPFIIENKAGAGGIIATDAVAKSPPDGYSAKASIRSAAHRPSSPPDRARNSAMARTRQGRQHQTAVRVACRTAFSEKQRPPGGGRTLDQVTGIGLSE